MDIERLNYWSSEIGLLITDLSEELSLGLDTIDSFTRAQMGDWVGALRLIHSNIEIVVERFSLLSKIATPPKKLQTWEKEQADNIE